MSIDPQQQELPQGGPMSVQDYLYLDRSTPDGKYEYLDGSARLMSGGSVEHDLIAYNTRVALNLHFFSGPCAVFGSDMQTLVGVKPDGRENYFYPDVTLSCDVADRRRGNKLIRSPRIVVEVLSPGMEVVDRGKKLDAYKACSSIQEIVLISQFSPYVEVYRRNEEDAASWSHAFYTSGMEVELASVDVRISMDEIYKGIDFDEPLIEE
jgi:Uma2 family endonuclease